ncbi:hypothetical protein PHAVU_003G168301 [Phaseolus vulgaris]
MGMVISHFSLLTHSLLTLLYFPLLNPPTFPISPLPPTLFLIITFAASTTTQLIAYMGCEISPCFSSLKSWSCFSTAFLNFFCILYLSASRILSPRSSRKLWENMAIQAFPFVILPSSQIQRTR